MNYIFALGFVKLSILFFYRAIASHRTFRRFVNCAIAFVCMYTLGTTLASIFMVDGRLPQSVLTERPKD
jgi:hypothetical protein